MVPAGNNLQKATALKHPTGMSSWDVRQGLTSGPDLQVPSSSIVQYIQVPSPSTVWYTQQQHSPGCYSVASNSSAVWYPHAQSSSEGQYPQQTLQVQHSWANDSSSEMRRTGICQGCLSIHRTLLMLSSPKFCVYLLSLFGNDLITSEWLVGWIITISEAHLSGNQKCKCVSVRKYWTGVWIRGFRRATGLEVSTDHKTTLISDCCW
jgi:hypothetical protein